MISPLMICKTTVIINRFMIEWLLECCFWHHSLLSGKDWSSYENYYDI